MASIDSYVTQDGIRYRVHYRTPDRKPAKKSGFKTKRAAKAFKSQIEVALQVGSYTHPSAGKITIAEVKEKWAPGLEALAPRTKKSNLSSYRVHVAPRWGKWPVNKITAPEVRKWVFELQEAGTGTDTIKRAVFVLRSILDVAVEDKRLSENPVHRIKVSTGTKDRRPYLTAQQVKVLAEAMPTKSDTAVIYTLAYCGHRINELTAMDVADYLKDRQRFSVTKAMKGGSIVGSTKTNENRTVPIPAFLLPMLDAITEGRSPDEPLFLSPEGMRINSDNFRRRVFEPALTKAKENWAKEHKLTPFPDLTPHGLRHTCASLAISVGANVKAVQAMLGHKTASITLDTYSDLFPDDLASVADALDNLFNTARLK